MDRYWLYDSGAISLSPRGDYVLYSDAIAEIESLRAKLAEAEKDAERYQLRYETLRALFGNLCPSETELDAAINAAIAKQKGE